MMLETGITLIWFAIIAFGIFMYVLLDGFVLGIGILFPFAGEEADRDVMMNSVAPIWDGNETWLVLGGMGLFAAFPIAYAVILPALYLPLIGMVMALVFRGVAFEFRFKSGRRRYLWNIAFFGGSLVAAFWQGLSLGAIVQGFEIADGQYGGGAFDWVTPFSLFTGGALVAGYALLGSSWLVMKTEGALQAFAYRTTIILLGTVLAAIAVISIWVPFLSEKIAARWFSWPNIALLSWAPILTVAVGFALWRSVQRRHTYLPFIEAMGLFLLGYAGLAISIWPNIIPPDVSIWEAAAPVESQLFLLVGVLFLLPVILGYTAYSYWIFRGKVTRDAGYHH